MKRKLSFLYQRTISKNSKNSNVELKQLKSGSNRAMTPLTVRHLRLQPILEAWTSQMKRQKLIIHLQVIQMLQSLVLMMHLRRQERDRSSKMTLKSIGRITSTALVEMIMRFLQRLS